MKKIALTLLCGSALFASEEIAVIECPSCEITAPDAHHEIRPAFNWLRHKEQDYTYSKYIGGIEYNYKQATGVNFNSFFGYSLYKDKTYFVADWGIKYLTKLGVEKENLDFYPILGMTSSSHFSVNNETETMQIYRSAMVGGLGVIYSPWRKVQLETNVNYFKDVATSCILHKGDEFWGKNYFSPAGYKINLGCKFLSVFSKDIELGGFYAKTFKKCYDEFGFKTAVSFVF